MLLLHQILTVLENYSPFSLQENYDNSGLLIGHPEMEITGAILSLDVTDDVLEEAISKGCNLIIAHHPILFSGLKRITGSGYVERVVIKAIKNNLAIIAVHTNLDNVKHGVNQLIADKLGIVNTRILSPTRENLLQLYTYVPASHLDQLKTALYDAGAGLIGKYEHCSFSFSGTGTFKPTPGADPFSGTIGIEHSDTEHRLEVILPAHRKQQVLQALRKAHPYEEIAHGLLDIGMQNPDTGAGLIGELRDEIPAIDFLEHVKTAMKCQSIRYTRISSKPIRTVALCGGSGIFLLPEAMKKKADIYITSDVKYHQFFDADGRIILADIGHYESEQFTPEIFYRVLSEKFPTFALQISSVNTNPVSYL